MGFFNTAALASLADLKTQYRTLAMQHHPDRGGSTEAMQAINNEFDQLFIVWKRREPKPAAESTGTTETADTAQAYRSEFYTQSGWKGKNYDSKLSLKEIAVLIREFIKLHYNDFRFSVTTDYFSGGCSLDISMTEGPVPAYKTPEEWTEEEQQEAQRAEWRWKDRHESAERIERHRATLFLNDYVREAREAVEDYARSFNWSDCDGQIDYFNVNFWFHGVQMGKWDKEYKVVPRTRTAPTFTEYRTEHVTKTRTYKAIEPQEIPAPATIAPGQHFIIKSRGFNYAIYRGAVYQIVKGEEDRYISAYKMDKKRKNMCTGSSRGNHFSTSVEKFKEWVEKGALAFVKLVEVEKTEEYKSARRVPVVPPPSTQQASEEERAAHASTGQGAAPSPYTVTPDTDTRDGSPLWVLTFQNRLTREEYTAARDALKTIQGYYSKFKKGFIFKYDPAAALARLYGEGGQPAEAPAPEDAAETARRQEAARSMADNIEDKSTEIIRALRIEGSQYAQHPEYRRQMAAYIAAHREQITTDVLACVGIPGLGQALQSLLDELAEDTPPDSTAPGPATPAPKKAAETPGAAPAETGTGYDVPALLAMPLAQYTEWYMAEMARLNPNAQAGMGYSVADAEWSYKQLHEAAEQAAAS